MHQHTETLLVVDDDRTLAGAISAHAQGQGLSAVSAATPGEVEAALARHHFDVVLLDLGFGGGAGFDVMNRIKSADGDTEIVVTSADASLTSAIRSYDLSAFSFVPKPLHAEQLFSTLMRALERRRMHRDNRRLVWELQTVNEIAEGVARSLDLDDILIGALQRAIRALSAVGGSIRLRNEVTGAFDVHAVVGPPGLHQMWARFDLREHRPSERVIQTGAAVIVEDLRALAAADAREELPACSAVSVPMFAGDALLGTVTLGADRPYRFGVADQRLLATIAGQISVAVQNARLHQSISRGKREWEETFDAISDPVAVIGARGEVLRGNRALARETACDVTELRGRDCHSLGLCPTGPNCPVFEALGGVAGRSQITRDDGRIFSVTTFPITRHDAGPLAVLIAKDVTEEIHGARRLRQLSEQLADANARSTAALERLRATQAQLLQAEKLSAIGQLVAGVAHELNNPLTSVIGYSQLLQEELKDQPALASDQISSDLRRIAAEAERAARIVRNLLAFARRQSAAREPRDVADMVSRMLALRTYDMRMNGIELETEFEPGLPMVIADAGQLQQALLNLVLNAEQAMRHREPRRLTVTVRVDPEAAAVVVAISDTGHGIETENLSRIFDPFFTTRDVGEGTGLGLSICYGIVRDHGGEIHVDSTPGAGTRFEMLLPACPAMVPSQGVLVAHAGEGERAYLAAMLTGWGYRVSTAGTSADALARVASAPLESVIVDRALVASDLPGWRAAVERLAPGTLVFVSSSADDAEVDRFGREHAAAVVAPPFPLRSVHAAISGGTRELV